ncbi:hypothetical protein EJ08DRAFT_682263 [Tothia fuscella]|uniref:Uncharacterized protein n=1 Tax=Tothia fuscella TaxID=1048955 RepID=A0A9P4NJL3_9PEZI|nr:hypothetical protein EJ08DRAFT_682263 [Tothia fuscella]
MAPPICITSVGQTWQNSAPIHRRSSLNLGLTYGRFDYVSCMGGGPVYCQLEEGVEQCHGLLRYRVLGFFSCRIVKERKVSCDFSGVFLVMDAGSLRRPWSRSCWRFATAHPYRNADESWQKKGTISLCFSQLRHPWPSPNIYTVDATSTSF